MKKNIIRFSLVLGVISVVTGFGLAAVYQVTRARIEQKERVAFEAALKSMFPDATGFAPLSAGKEGAAGEVWDQKGVAKAVRDSATLGYVCVGEQQGYSSRIRVLVACDTAYAVKSVQVLFAAETPGLGERIKEVKSELTVWEAAAQELGLSEKKGGGAVMPWFQAQFTGKTIDKLVVVKGDTKDNIQAITAATVTSRAVTAAVKAALEEIMRETGAQAPEEAR